MERLFSYREDSLPLAIFEDISAIPRASGKEAALAAYLIERLNRVPGVEAFLDRAGNVVAKKKGTSGSEDAEPVILQAHMDMVCEKLSTSTHDFDRDPIALLCDGDRLHADGTTLGVDDGIGVALLVAALESEEIVHPPLEALLTVREELDFYGAEQMEGRFFQGHRVINLDHAADDQVIVGSCGGTGLQINLPANKEAVGGEKKTFALAIEGMPGGHSGEDIHRGRGSAIQLMTRLLRKLQAECEIALVQMAGGTSRTAIARDCRATVLGTDAVLPLIAEQEAIFAREYRAVCPELKIGVEEVPAATEAYSRETFRNLLTLLTLFPDGIMKMNGAFDGVVESSVNLGIVDEREGELYLEAEVRGGYESTVEDIRDKVTALTELFGGRWIPCVPYAPWPYNPDSALKKTAKEVYLEQFGAPMEEVVLHAGLECGMIGEAIEGMDAISIGPNCQNLHSPSECVSIASVRKEWVFLKALLRALR